VEIECQLDATEVFIADLIACSIRFGHHYATGGGDKKCIQGLGEGNVREGDNLEGLGIDGRMELQEFG
jgi:hypothetical protein